MSELPKKITKEAAREVASQLFWSAWPYWGAPLVTAALAWIGGYPATIIFLMALGAFAMISLALNNYAQWRERQSAADKVDFVAPIIGINNVPATDPPELRGLKLGVSLRSRAPFPMEIRIDELETQIVDRVPNESFYVRSITVGQGITANFSNALIDLTGLERADKVIYGRITASVTYGRPGRLKYPAERQWYMAFKFDKNGNFETAEPSLTAFAKANGN